MEIISQSEADTILRKSIRRRIDQKYAAQLASATSVERIEIEAKIESEALQEFEKTRKKSGRFFAFWPWC